MEVITARIPRKLFREIEKIKEDEQVGTAEAIRKLLVDAVKRYKLKKALDLLKDHRVSYRRAAKIADISLCELYEEATKEKIEIGYTLDELEKDLSAES